MDYLIDIKTYPDGVTREEDNHNRHEQHGHFPVSPLSLGHPKVLAGVLRDCPVHPDVHDGDESKGEQHHDDKVGYQEIVPAVGHSLSQFSGTNLS